MEPRAPPPAMSPIPTRAITAPASRNGRGYGRSSANVTQLSPVGARVHGPDAGVPHAEPVPPRLALRLHQPLDMGDVGLPDDHGRVAHPHKVLVEQTPADPCVDECAPILVDPLDVVLECDRPPPEPRLGE